MEEKLSTLCPHCLEQLMHMSGSECVCVCVCVCVWDLYINTCLIFLYYTQQAKACEFERELLAQSDGCMNITFVVSFWLKLITTGSFPNRCHTPVLDLWAFSGLLFCGLQSDINECVKRIQVRDCMRLM